MNLTDKLDPTHTALIVIDMQNDFCSPDGLMARMGKDISRMDTLVANIHSLVNVCENRHIPILYTQQIYDRTKLNELQNEQYDLDGRMITCDINETGWEFYGFTPPEDQVYEKYNYNIFSNERLIEDLHKANIKTLVITGVSTQICVETAIRNGFDLGYKIIVPSDLIGTTSSNPTIQERTLDLVKKTYGIVSSSAEITVILNGRDS
jgi:ureidoacrylate peracid hydrolase